MNKKTLSLQDILKLVNAEKKGHNDFLDVTIGKGFYEVDGLCIGGGYDVNDLLPYLCNVVKSNRNLYVLPETIYLSSECTGTNFKPAELR
jgi:hypothetical protein